MISQRSFQWVNGVLYLILFMTANSRAWGQDAAAVPIPKDAGAAPLPKDAGAVPVPNVETLEGYNECHEYVPPHRKKDVQAACRVDFDMKQTLNATLPPQTHKDVTVHLGPKQRGLVVLWHSSPFAVCSLSTTPGPLARDLSANVPAEMTALAGVGGSVGQNIAEPPTNSNPATPNAAQSGPGLALVPEVLNAQEQQQFMQQATAEVSRQLGRQLKNKPQQLADKAQQQASERMQREIENRRKENEARRAKLESIQEQEAAIRKAFIQLDAAAALYGNLNKILAEVNQIKLRLLYSYPNNNLARRSIQSIDDLSTDVVGTPIPDPTKTQPTLEQQLDGIKKKIDQLQKDYSGVGNVNDFVNDARNRLASAKAVIDKYDDPKVVATIVYVTDTQKKIEAILDFVRDWEAQDNRTGNKQDASVQVLPIALYPESKVAVTVKCVDGPTQNQIFDSIQFNAYFQAPPQIDLSAGVVISLLPNRTASVVTPSANPAPNTPTQACTQGDTSASPVVCVTQGTLQFMPGVFGEWHPWNFKLPGVKDPAYAYKKADFVACEAPVANLKDLDQWKTDSSHSCGPTWMSLSAPRHPLGYVGSFGFAGGVMANPNSGSTQAEYFGGVSLGIQRVAFLFGAHFGHSLVLADGYANGQQVPTGTTLPTTNQWQTAFAVGITYRVALR